jgi:hypothetical protein
MTTTAKIVLLGAFLFGAVEFLLARFWVPLYWRGPAVRLRRPSGADPDAAAILAAVVRRDEEAWFAGFGAREIGPGRIALRENEGQRGPHLTCYPALRAHLLLERRAVTLALAPSPSAILLAAGGLLAVLAAWHPLLIGAPILSVVVASAAIQVVQLRGLLEVAAAAGATPTAKK